MYLQLAKKFGERSSLFSTGERAQESYNPILIPMQGLRKTARQQQCNVELSGSRVMMA
jgi:hypothetical protein